MMITSILRSIGAGVLGLLVALILVIAIEGVSTVLHPFPPLFDGTAAAMIVHVANYPVWVLALLGGAGWGVTVFVSSWLATRIGTGRHPAHGLVVGGLLLLAAFYNMYLLPYPIWFVVLDFIFLPLCIYVGVRLGALKKVAD